VEVGGEGMEIRQVVSYVRVLAGGQIVRVGEDLGG